MQNTKSVVAGRSSARACADRPVPAGIDGAPAFRPALIDRFLIALGRGGVRPLLCVNTLDLLPADRTDVEKPLRRSAPWASAPCSPRR